MPNHQPNFLQLGGLLATGLVSTAILGFPTDSSAFTSATTEIVKALAPNFAHQFLSSIDYARFKDFVIKAHPDDLNHDLERLIKDALLRVSCSRKV